MTRSYKMVLLENAAPGMVLSDNLLDRHGKILLPEGTTLTDKLLESLRRQEMEMIPVFCEAMSEQELQARIAQRQARLDKLFRKHDYGDPEDNANEVLLQYLKEFRRGGEV